MNLLIKGMAIPCMLNLIHVYLMTVRKYKHLRCRCLGGMTTLYPHSTNTTIHHSTNTATADACMQDFCTTINSIQAIAQFLYSNYPPFHKHSNSRCMYTGFLYTAITMSHTQQQTAAVIPFCTAITTQYNSYAIRSQSVLTTNSSGRVYKVQFECRARHSTYTSEIASIARLHNFLLLSCDLSASRQSTVDSFVYGEL